MQEISGPVVDGSDPTGHIISTTIGGKNGEPKQVSVLGNTYLLRFFPFLVQLLEDSGYLDSLLADQVQFPLSEVDSVGVILIADN